VIRTLPVLLSLALTVYCVIDAIQTDEIVMRNLSKLPWILIILFFPVIGPVAWLVAGRPERSARSGPTQQQRWDDHRRRRDGGRPGGRTSPPRGPDDDPDFLKDL
jgi:hypothetical protein